MKQLLVVLMAALALAPAAYAADEAAESAAAAAKPKKKLQLKPVGYMQLEKAKAEALKYEVPILVLVTVDGDEKSALLKKYLFNNKLFKEFCAQNCTKLFLKGKKSAVKGQKGIDLASFKKEREFIEANIMGEAAKDAKPEDAEFYPGAFIVSSDGSKKLTHLPKYNPELGFGAWAMDVVAKLEQAGITATVTPALKKAIEDPQPDIKQPAAKGKKK